MIDIMDWDDWIKLTDAEQEAVRQRYETFPRGEWVMIGGFDVELSVEDQRRLLEQLQCAETIGLHT